MKNTKFTSKALLIALLFAAPVFIACKDKDAKVEKAPTIVNQPTLEQKKQTLQNVAGTSSTAVVSSASGALNPAHGQPGHRCDIPVGAPLDGSAASTKGQSTPINLNNTNTTPAATSGNVKINPPHGQPGHRCDVKVGDPL